MIVVTVLAAALALAPQNAPAQPDAWTWTLYADSSPIVLAHEVPDTARLRATLECEPGSGAARLTLYGGAAAAGLARMTAGDATAVSEAEAGRDGGARLVIRTDHPTFAAFGAEGRLQIAIGDQRRSVEVAPPHLAKLRRFAELCSG